MENKLGCQIVEFEETDKDEVIRVIDRLLKELGVIPESEELIDDDDLFKIGEIYSGRGRFWVAKIDGKVVGTVAIREMNESEAVLNRMFVLSEYHGSGIGQSLFDRALEFVKDQGYKKVRLTTHVLMNRAHRFYEKNGFKRVRQDGDLYCYEMGV